MAAVSVQPSPRSMSIMTSRRIPLANNPNAANSPFRAVPSVAGKRTRAQSNDPRELISGQPPSKKQVIDLDNDENVGPRQFTRQSQIEKEAESRVFTRKPINAPMTTLEKKFLAASREKKLGQPMQIDKSPDKSRRPGDGLENIRQWQRHYKKAFPQFVFYFESVPDDVRRKMSQQVQMLGAVCRRPMGSSRMLTDVVAERRKVLFEVCHSCCHNKSDSAGARHKQSRRWIPDSGQD